MNPDLYYESTLTPEEAAEIDKFRNAVLAVNPNLGRDWVEDFTQENGQYQCTCIYCKSGFVGYKRRVMCKACHEQNQELLKLRRPTLAPLMKPIDGIEVKMPSNFLKVPDHLKPLVAQLPDDFMKIFPADWTAAQRIDYLMDHSEVFRRASVTHPQMLHDMLNYILSEMSEGEPTEDQIQAASMALQWRLNDERAKVEAQSKSLGGIMNMARKERPKRVSKTRKKK